MEKFYLLQGSVCAKTIAYLSTLSFIKDKIKLYTAAIAFGLFLFSGQLTAQIPVTVTGGSNTTPALLANYPSLAAALVDVNAVTAMTGAVTLTLSAGASETTPPAGLTIGSATLNPVLSSTNSITIIKAAGAATTLNAGIGVATPASATPDGILKIAGANYITIDGLTLTDGNVTNPATMEFGIALFKWSTSDGAQNNTIQNCTLNMQRLNNASGVLPMVEGSVNILVINSTPTAATTALVPVSAAGSNSNNKFYSNSLNNGNYGIVLYGYTAPSPYTLADTGNDIGGSSSVTGNTILNFGGAVGTNPSAGIRANQQWSANISYNTINSNDGSGVNHPNILRGIYGQSAVDANIDITNNTVTVHSGATTSTLAGIDNLIGGTGTSNTVTVSNNTIQNCTYSTATTGAFTGIDNSVSAVRVYVEGNTVTNNTLGTSGTGTSGAFTGILAGGTASGELNVNSNTITNNTKNGSSGTSSCLTIGAGAGIVDGNIISDNTLNLTGTTSTTFHGINNSTASGASLTISNNSVSNLTHTGSNTGTSHVLNGISSLTGSAAAKTINNNTINNLQFTNTSTGSVTITGINHTTSTSVNIYGNKIYDLIASNGAGSVVLGITNGTSSTTANIYNNLIGNLANSQASAADAVKGINITNISANNTINVSYNTVYLNATSTGTNFGTSGIFHTGSTTATTGTLNLRNNIIVNLSTPNGTGITAAYRRGNVSFANYGATSNHNLFYAGVPGATRFIFYFDATTSDQTLADYKLRVTPRDANSVTENPPFLSTAGANSNFLHINTATATQVESGASNVTGITDDFDSQIRQGNAGYAGSGSAPDIGADEGNFTSADLSAPLITYTPLTFTCSTGDRALNGVTITDASGVPIAGALQPRVYFKKNVGGTWFSSQGTLASGNSTNGTWNFTIVAASMGGIMSTDVIYYYVIAQDENGTPNVGANPGTGLVATNVNTVTTHPTTPNTYTINNALNGTYNVGAGQTFTTLTAAITAYNTGCLTGPVVFQLMDASYSGSETFPLVINANMDASITNTLTIRPNAGTAVSISGTSGAVVSALIKLNGADYIIFDGLNTGGASLTIENTSITDGTAVFWLSSNGVGAGARNNAIKNLTIKSGLAPNSSTNDTYGIVFGGSSLNTTPASISAGDDNDNNLISENTIIKVRYGLYLRGGATTNLNTGTVITLNNIGPNAFGEEAIGRGGIVVREEDGIQITGNNIGFIGGDFDNAPSGIDRVGITFGTDASWTPTATVVKNAIVTNNRIHHIVDEQTFSAVGIAMGTDGTVASNNLVANNMLYNIKANGTLSDKAVAIGTSSGNGDKIVFNSIFLTGDTDPHASAGAPSQSNFGIQITSATNVTNPLIRNNIVYMDLTSSSAPTIKNAAIDIPTSFSWGTGNSNYNDLYILPSNTQSNIGSIGSTAGTFYNTLPLWRTASSQDLQSINAAPTFTSSTDLHLVPASNGALNDFGIPVPGVTLDIDGNTRDAVSPDMGVDEFNPPAGADIGATALVTPATNTCYTNAETVTVAITNFGIATIDFGVNNVTVAASTTGPVAYSSNTVLSTGTLASGASMNVVLPAAINMSGNGVYVFTISATVSGDINTANDATIHNRSSLSLGGTYTVGSGGNYTTLTAAIADYNNANCLSAPVVFSLTDATYTTPAETFPIVINDNAFAGSTTLTIKPATGMNTTITGSLNSAGLIRLNSADYIIIDGSNNGSTSRNLTITNSSTTAPTAVTIASLGTDLGATNNTVKNCNLNTGVVTSGASYGVSIGAATPGSSAADNDNVTIQNNNITIATVGIYAIGTASTSTGGLDNLTLTGNSVTTNTTLATIGIRVGNGLNSLIEKNTISVENSTTTTSPVAISVETGFVSSTVSKNFITKSLTTNTGGYGGRGITVGTGTATSALTLSNNVIYGVNGSNETTFGNSSSMGIALGIVGASTTLTTTAGGINLYYNSVNMAGNYTDPDNCVTTALYVGSGVTGLDMRDNVLVNTLFNDGAGTGAKAYSIYSVAANSAYSTMNYNCYYVGASQGVLAFLGSDQLTLAALQTAFGQNANSIATNPLYNTNTNLQPQPGTPLINAGTAVVGITTDITDVVRNVSTPTIGAFEQSIDIAAPTISYTALTYTCTTGNRSLNGVNIIDATGLPIAGALQPRIYYKKNIGGSWFSSQGTLASGSATNGIWNFTIIAADMGGLASGDHVYYYVIAQDVAGTPNVTANPGSGLVATNVNTVTTHPTDAFRYRVSSPLMGTYTVGSGGAFTTLTEAVYVYNNSCLSGAVTFSLTNATYSGGETFPIVISNHADANITNTLTIRPEAATAVSITGTSGTTASALIQLDGADYIIIDGMNTGGASLTIENTSSTSGIAALWLASQGVGLGATNNIIRNTNLKASVNQSTTTTSNYGIVIGGNSLGTISNIAPGDDNDNNTIEGNTITKVRYGIAIRGGSSTNLNTGNVISNNIIGPSSFGSEIIGKGGIVIREEDGTQIMDNEIRYIGGSYSEATSGTDRIGIAIGTDALWSLTSVFVQNAVIERNIIHDIIDERVNSAIGIAIGADGTNLTNNTIANNMLYNIKANGSSTNLAAGIVLSSANTDRVVYNTIYMTGDSDPDAAATATVSSNFGLYIATTSVANSILKDNIVYMDMTSSSAPTIPNACIGVPAAFSFGTGSSNYNDFYIAPGNSQSRIGAVSTTFHATLAEWQTAVAQDANSLNVLPTFVSPTNLHLVPASNLGLNNMGSPEAGITEDIDGDARDVATPDMGADEFTPVLGIDVGISGLVTPAASGCYTAAETVTVTLVNNSLTALNFSTNNVTVTVTATGGYNSNIVLNSGILAGNSSMPVILPATINMSTNGTYTFNANTSVSGDVQPGNDAMAPVNRTVAALAGTIPVGVGQSAFGGTETLTELIQRYTTATCISGNVVAELYDALYTAPGETFPLVIPSNPLAGTYTLTIRPRPATAVTITGTGGASATALIKLDGADYIIINGINSGGASLSIENTSVTSGSAAIWLSSNGVGAGATNNRIENVRIKGAVDQNSSSTNTYGIVMAGSTLSSTVSSVTAGNDNDNNVITNNTFTKLRHGIYTRGGSSTNLNTGTVISNNTFGPSSFGSDIIGKAGIIAREENGIQITGNEIRYIGGPYATATSGTDRAGIVLSTLADWTTSTAIFVKNAIVANNIIHDIVDERGNSAVGITVNCDSTGGTNNAFVNNVIYNLRANGISDFTIGLGLDEGKGDLVAFNSIYLSGDTDPDAGASAPTSGNTGILINASTFANPVLRNNVVYMDLFSSSAPTLAENACVKVPSSYNWGTGFSNDNNFYINPYNSQSNIGSVGTTYYFDLLQWGIATDEDDSSLSADPQFNSTTNLRPRPNSPLLNAGEPITGVTTDILGVTRNLSDPTIGAYEGSIDQSGPVISYSLLTANTLCTSNVNISAAISDPALVNVTAGTKPRLYFKKSTEANTYAGNTSAFNGWKYVEATNSTSPFNFTTDYSLLFSAIAPGDIIQYFVVAQDQSITPYVSVSGATLASTPTSVALASGAFPATGMNSYSILTGPGLSSNVTIGAVGATYTTLSGTGGLFAAINTSGLSANITATILDATLPETGAVALNSIAYGCGGPYTLTIKPGTGVTTLLSGSTTSSLITLNGADNVVIDGSNNGTSTKDMRIRNLGTGATANTLRLSGNSTYNTIQNVIIEGLSTTSTNGVVLFGLPGVGKEGNSNNDIINCEIRDRSDASATAPNTGIYSSGLSSGPNSANRIMGCNIYNFSGTGVNISSKGIISAWEVSSCNFYNAQATASGSAQNGILVANGTEHTISGNTIGGNAVGATGVWTNTGAVAVHGISITGGSAKITGNTIANINGTSTSTSARVRGIAFSGTISGAVISNNSVHDLLSSSARTGLTVDFVPVTGIYHFPPIGLTTTISNNTVYNISAENATALTASIVSAGLAITNYAGSITGNKIYNIRNKGTGSTANQPPIAAGIFARSVSNSTIANNMVSLGSTDVTNTQFNGIMNPSSVSGTHNYYHNSVYISGTTTGSWGSNAYLRGDNSGVSVTPTINLRNNIFVMERTGGTSVNYAISNQGSSAGTNWTSNFNDLYNSVPANTGFWNATGYNFAGWQANSGGDANSLNVAPVFTSTTDLHLTVANTGLDNSGTPLANVTIDIDNDTRNFITPDMGYDEFISTGCPKVVTDAADSGPNTLRGVIACAQTGETITIDPSVTSITLTSGEIALNKSLVLKGHGVNTITISGNNNSRIFNLLPSQTFRIEAMKLINGSSLTEGGAFYNQGIMRLMNITIEASTENAVPKGFTGAAGSTTEFIGTTNVND